MQGVDGFLVVRIQAQDVLVAFLHFGRVFHRLRCIDSLSVLLAPFLPHTSEKLHGFFAYPTPLFGTVGTSMVSDDLGTHNVLRYNPAGSIARWEPSRLQPGSPLVQPLPLFKKLDASIVAEERARLGK